MSSLGRAYSKADFVSFYGGTAEWERSPVYLPPAGPGGAAPSEHHKSATEAKAEALLHSKTGQKMQAAAADWGLPASSDTAAPGPTASVPCSSSAAKIHRIGTTMR